MDYACLLAIYARKLYTVKFVCELFVCHESGQRIGAAEHHCYLTGTEHIAQTGIIELCVGRRNALVKQVNPALDTLLGIRIIKSGCCLILI